MRVHLAVLSAALLLLPFAEARDPFRDPVCLPDAPCVPVYLCLGGVPVLEGACQTHTCDPVTACGGDVHAGRACGVNATYVGETCVTGASLELTLAGDHAGAEVSFAEGNVTGRNIWNTWSTIDVAAGASDGPNGETVRVSLWRETAVPDNLTGVERWASPGENHTYHRLGLNLTAAGMTAFGAGGNVILMDLRPEMCRVDPGLTDAWDCPRR